MVNCTADPSPGMGRAPTWPPAERFTCSHLDPWICYEQVYTRQITRCARDASANLKNPRAFMGCNSLRRIGPEPEAQREGDGELAMGRHCPRVALRSWVLRLLADACVISNTQTHGQAERSESHASGPCDNRCDRRSTHRQRSALLANSSRRRQTSTSGRTGLRGRSRLHADGSLFCSLPGR
jgi:hypothetical protein